MAYHTWIYHSHLEIKLKHQNSNFNYIITWEVFDCIQSNNETHVSGRIISLEADPRQVADQEDWVEVGVVPWDDPNNILTDWWVMPCSDDQKVKHRLDMKEIKNDLNPRLFRSGDQPGFGWTDLDRVQGSSERAGGKILSGSRKISYSPSSVNIL